MSRNVFDVGRFLLYWDKNPALQVLIYKNKNCITYIARGYII